ncbi:MAG: hypothetical protein VX130_07930 [Verrucomicrobiota bacterium]|nr:hypothetical protein [Verrucomicrobiota bacterium]
MKFLHSHYEKIVFGIILLFISFLFLLTTTQEVSTEEPTGFRAAAPFDVEQVGNELKFKFAFNQNLMPGDRVTVFVEDEEFTLTVQKVLFPRRTEVEVLKKDGKIIQGRVPRNQDYEISENWNTKRNVFGLEKNRNTISIPYQEISTISGSSEYTLSAPETSLNWDDAAISTYQVKTLENVDSNRSDRIKWSKASTDLNSSIYDTFTPPIIYLVNGKLSTKLPEKKIVVKEEPFGLELLSFTQTPYPLRLSSWIGQTPYFEDTEVEKFPGSGQNIVNRIEVGVPYKKNLNRSPGQPSLIKSTPDENSSKLTVEFFTVQQIKLQDGSLKTVGRALLKDHELGGKAFEINSLMKEVFVGDFEITLKFQIDDVPSREFIINQKSPGSILMHEGRQYKIIDINTEKRTVLVDKTGLPGQEPQRVPLTISEF